LTENQLDLFGAPVEPDYNAFNPSEGFVEERDRKRLKTQTGRIFTFMQDHQWHTLAEISAATGAPEASLSADLRLFRRADWGAYQLDSEHIPGTNGLWRYRLGERGAHVPRLKPCKRCNRATEREAELLAALGRARTELDRWGHGDFHYGDMPRDPRVLAALADIDAVITKYRPKEG
jgi:hypothetical protein